jgi:hypothetical protein
MTFLDTSEREFESKRRALEEDAKERRRVVARAAELKLAAEQEVARREITKFWRNVVIAVALTALAALGFAFWRVSVDRDSALHARDEAETARRRAEAALKEAAEANVAVTRTIDTQKAIFSAASPELQRQIEDLQAKVGAKPLVYVQYASSRQAEFAAQLQSKLNAADYSAPGTEQVTAAPARNEVRYFRKEDESAARELAARLRDWGVTDVNVKLVQGYEARTQVRQFEVWLATDEIDRLFQSLTAASQADRQDAGQTLQTRYAASPAAIAAALKLLSPESVLKLSVDGRINILYYLTRTDPDAWNAALVQQARDGLHWLADQEKTGLQIGSQTRAEIQRLKSLLERVPGSGQPTKKAS